MAKTAKRRIHGGRFISSGKYGCTYTDPPLKCKGEDKRRSGNIISKLMGKSTARDELLANDKFKRIDPTKKYTLWTDEACEFDRYGLTRSNEMSKNGKVCDYKDVIRDTNNAMILFVDKANSDLHEIKLSPLGYSKFFTGFTNLIEGLVLFAKNNILHCDIKPPNIVSTYMPDGSYKLQYIDFGTSVYIDTIDIRNEYTKNVVYGQTSLYTFSSASYPYYPFEFKFLYNPDKIAYSYKEFIKNTTDYIRSIPQNSIVSSTKMNAILEKLHLYDMKYILQKIDIYSLGITFSEIYSKLVGHYSNDLDKRKRIILYDRTAGKLYDIFRNKYYIPEDILAWHTNVAMKVSVPMYEMIEHMINFDIGRRKTPQEILNEFTSTILPNLSEAFDSPHTKKSLAFLNIKTLDEPVIQLDSEQRLLPKGWKVVRSGKDIWYVSPSGKSQWESPLITISNVNSTGNKLPEGWRMKISGKDKWYVSPYGISQWENPNKLNRHQLVNVTRRNNRRG